MLDSISRYLAKICEWLIGGLMVIMTCVVMIGVFYRYVLGYGLPWTEELARYVMIWMCFLAASILIREDGHIGITVLRDHLSPRWKAFFYVLSDMAVIVFLTLWCSISIESYEIIKYDISPGVNLPLGVVFISQPVCAFLMLVQTIIILIKHMRTLFASRSM